MQYKPLLVAVALAVALLAASGPAAADHGSTHDIELYGTATYTDGTPVDSAETIYLVENTSEGYTELDNTTLAADGVIATQSTGDGEPLAASVENGTALEVHLGGINDTRAIFPQVDDLTKLTNESQTAEVDALFAAADIDVDHSAELVDGDGTTLARWDGSDYVDDGSTEQDTYDETTTTEEPYWSYPTEENESTTEGDDETVVDDTDDTSWFSFEWLFGTEDVDQDDLEDEADDSPWSLSDLLDRLRGR
jgi:hypothetical protein